MGREVESSIEGSDGRTHTKDVHLQFPATADEGEYDKGVAVEAEAQPMSIEEGFDQLPIPSWREQITVRALVVGTIIGGFFSIITHKLSLTTGVIPSFNVAAGLIGFFLIKLWVSILTRLKIWSTPFTRQENTVIQTCAVSCFGLSFSGGYGMYLIAMDRQSYLQSGVGAGNRAVDVKQPALGWMVAYIFTTAFLGIMAIVPLRKLMILRYKLTYPSGTATAVLINGFHTPLGAMVAKKQVRSLLWSGGMSLFFSFFKWFFSGDGSNCGFEHFPSLGLEARENKFLFDFSLVYIGAGMICPHIVNISVLLGAILSWGILWPIIEGRAGDWYPAEFAKVNNFKGLYAYKIFLAIGLIIGDGLYQFVKLLILTGISFYKMHKESTLPQTVAKGVPVVTPDEQKRMETFLKDSIPNWIAISGYGFLAIIAISVIPQIFPPVKWYFVLICYIVAPVLAFCNSYGMGLTDWSLTSTYGKISLFIFAAWAGKEGGVIAGLGTCGVMMTIVSSAADLMQDFKTGYLTRSSPRAMFVSQIFGTFMGCILAPVTFWMFWMAFDIGNPNGQYPAPFSILYRQMAIIGVNGFGALPKHCLELTAGFFAFGILVNVLKDSLPAKYSRFVPIPMAMGIPFYLGGYFTIDMFIGTVIVYVWQRLDKIQALVHIPAVASGLICGDGLWSVPAAILALFKVNPPICMAFFSTKEFLKKHLGTD